MKQLSHTKTETGGGFVATILKLKAYRQELQRQAINGLMKATLIEVRFNAYKRAISMKGGQTI